MNGAIIAVAGIVIAIVFLSIGMAIGELRYKNRPPDGWGWNSRVVFGEDSDE